MQTAVVTGAGSGFGRALCTALAAKGWKILVCDINQTGADETLLKVKSSGGSGEVYICDVSDGQAVQKMADYVFSSWGRVDLLINNAGVVSSGFIGSIPLPDWDWIIKINLMGAVNGCHCFIPYLKEQGSGCIVNTASAAGIVCLPEMGPYNVTKAGVISLSETLKGELAEHNIKVIAVCPSFFQTNLLKNMRYTDSFQKEFASTALAKGRMTADDIAKLVVKSLNKSRLYITPQLSIKLAWFSKRMTPNLFYNVIAFCERHGFGQKLIMKMAQWGLT